MGKPVKGMRCFNSRVRREMRAFLLHKYGDFCQICLESGKPALAAKIRLDIERDDLSFSFDHIIPLADGGLNELDNMWPAHVVCNERKGSKSGGSRRMDRESRQASNVIMNGARLAYSSVS